MKKILVTTALCLVGVSLMAQGRINFANNASTSPIRINNGTISWETNGYNLDPIIQPGPTTQVLGTGSTALFGVGPAAAQIRLYAGLTSTSLAPMRVGSAGTAEYVLNTASTIAAVQGTFPGGTTLNLGLPAGPTYLRFTATTADGLYLGVSPIILASSTASPAAAALVFQAAADASHWNGITMYIVPEPSTFALAGLGAAAMLIFRRRK